MVWNLNHDECCWTTPSWTIGLLTLYEKATAAEDFNTALSYLLLTLKRTFRRDEVYDLLTRVTDCVNQIRVSDKDIPAKAYQDIRQWVMMLPLTNLRPVTELEVYRATVLSPPPVFVQPSNNFSLALQKKKTPWIYSESLTAVASVDWLIKQICCSNQSYFACVDSLIDSRLTIMHIALWQTNQFAAELVFFLDFFYKILLFVTVQYTWRLTKNQSTNQRMQTILIIVTNLFNQPINACKTILLIAANLFNQSINACKQYWLLQQICSINQSTHANNIDYCSKFVQSTNQGMQTILLIAANLFNQPINACYTFQ